MVLNWSSRELPLNLGGYGEKDNACAIFVTYEKNDDRSESTQYPDEFIDRKHFRWVSRSGRNFSSPDLQSFINYKNNDVKFYLFVQKSKKDTDFYYIGQIDPENPKETTMENKGRRFDIVKFEFKLHNVMNENLYDYFITRLYED